MRNKLFLGGGIILLATVLFFVFTPAKHDGPTLFIGSKTIQLELADTEEKRTLGLGGREAMGENEGMLFVFPKADRYGIWMKGMRFPLDIIWLQPSLSDAQTLFVVDVKENVAVETYPEVFYPDAEARYVLELKGGSAQKNGIHVGSLVTLNSDI